MGSSRCRFTLAIEDDTWYKLPSHLPGCPSPTDSEVNRNVSLCKPLLALLLTASILLDSVQKVEVKTPRHVDHVSCIVRHRLTYTRARPLWSRTCREFRVPCNST